MQEVYGIGERIVRSCFDFAGGLSQGISSAKRQCADISAAIDHPFGIEETQGQVGVLPGRSHQGREGLGVDAYFKRFLHDDLVRFRRSKCTFISTDLRFN